MYAGSEQTTLKALLLAVNVLTEHMATLHTVYIHIHQSSAHTGQGWSAPTTTQPSITTTQAILSTIHTRVKRWKYYTKYTFDCTHTPWQQALVNNRTV